VVRADEAASWDDLHERFEVKRIDHQETYSLDGACTDMAEEYFSCLRRAGTGTRHHTAGSYLPRYAQGGVWTGEGEEWAMRVLIPALSVLGILICADTAKSDPSTTNRDLSASVDPATFTDEATHETEDQIGLDKGKRRDVQRRLTGLGFDTKGSGKFDESTAPSSRAGRGHAAIPRLASSTRCSMTRYWPIASRRRTPARAAARSSMTTIRPVVATGVVLTITAVVVVQAA
jgi:ISXO2-like transposase domain